MQSRRLQTQQSMSLRRLQSPFSSGRRWGRLQEAPQLLQDHRAMRKRRVVAAKRVGVRLRLLWPPLGPQRLRHRLRLQQLQLQQLQQQQLGGRTRYYLRVLGEGPQALARQRQVRCS